MLPTALFNNKISIATFQNSTTMKISSSTSLLVLFFLSSAGSASSQPFRLVNGKSDDILEAMSGEANEKATRASSPRIRIPSASASVAAPTFSIDETFKTSNKSYEKPVSDHKPSHLDLIDFHRRFAPTDESLNEDEATMLEAYIREAYTKIHQDGSNPSEVLPLHRRTDALEETMRKAFDKIHPSSSSILRRFKDLENLSQDESNYLATTIGNAFDKIHRNRGSTVEAVAKSVVGDKVAKNVEKMGNDMGGLRGSHKSPFIPIDREALKRFEQRTGKSF